LAKRGCYGDLPYEEVGSATFYNVVSEFDLWGRLPAFDEQAKRKALQFWQSWQDPKTGRFTDPRDPSRQVNEKYVLILLKAFGGEPLYPLVGSVESLAKDAAGNPDPTVFLCRTQEDPDWDQGGWSVGSHTGKMAAELFELIHAGQTELVPALEQGMNQILSHQNPATGMWGPSTAPLSGQLGGALKVINRFYFRMGMLVPHTKELADSLIAHEQNGDWHRWGEDICVPHNVVILVSYCLEASDYRREDLWGVLESKAREYQEWVNPDGSLLLRRGVRDAVGYEQTHVAGLRFIGLYLHWTDCRLLKPGCAGMPGYAGMYDDFVRCRHRPLLQKDGKVKIVDTQAK
jgi:hypothetical protein